jgi:hypothetical protein
VPAGNALNLRTSMISASLTGSHLLLGAFNRPISNINGSFRFGSLMEVRMIARGPCPFALWLHRLDNRSVALPTLVLKFDVLYGNGSGIRIQLGEGPIFGRPTAVNLISTDKLSGFVV